MGDFISREAAIRALRGNAEDRIIAGDGTYKGKLVPIKDAAKRIGKLPAADVAPVKRGHIVYFDRTRLVNQYKMEPTALDADGNALFKMLQNHFMEKVPYCSECGKCMEGRFLKVCDNCGARMDGGEPK